MRITLPKISAILLLLLPCAVFFAAPAKSTVSNCDVGSVVVINWGRTASLRKGLDGVGDFNITCRTNSGKANFCAYVNADDYRLRGDSTETNDSVPYTLYDGATNQQLGKNGTMAGPLFGRADIGGGHGEQRPITIHGKIRMKIQPQSGKFTAPQRFTNFIGTAIAMGDSDNFEDSCRSWNGKDNPGGWVDQWSSSQPFLETSFWLQTYCSIDSVGTLNFGKFPYLNKDIDAKADMIVDCSLGTKYSIGMGPGNNFKDGWRNMKNTGGDGFIRYGLYQDAGRSAPWSMAAGELYKNTSASLLPISVPVYGRVPRQGYPNSGNYADQVVITIKVTGAE